MRTTLLLLITIITLKIQSQPLVYFDFLSHNEETANWNGVPYYTANRSKLIALAAYFKVNKITWNQQSDWVYLTNVLTQETPALKASTGNKNILRWMYEDMGVEMDPHAHESQYIYPDVVKLMDSIGLPESKLMGGTIYNDSNGINIWTNLSNGQYGKKFPVKFWKPFYMMGGGTPNHTADLKYYGFWNPQSPMSYLTHDTSQHLRHIGVGCSLKVWDTTNVLSFVAQLREVFNNVQSGKYPGSGFYLQTIFFEQGDLNSPGFIGKLQQIADSVNMIVATGKAQWKTLKQTYTQWETVYNKKMFQWECGQIKSGITNVAPQKKIIIFPNPFTDKIEIQNMPYDNVCISIYNSLGQRVIQYPLTKSFLIIHAESLPSGIYYYTISKEQVLTEEGKLIKK